MTSFLPKNHECFNNLNWIVKIRGLTSKSDTICLYIYSDKWIKTGINIGICLGNNQHNFALNRFTISENIAKSFRGLVFDSHCILTFIVSNLQSTLCSTVNSLWYIMWTYCLVADSTCWHACEWQELSQWRRGNRCTRPLQFYTTSAVPVVPCTVPGTLSPLRAPNTSLSISFNVRLFYSLIAAVIVPKYYLQKSLHIQRKQNNNSLRAVSTVFMRCSLMTSKCGASINQSINQIRLEPNLHRARPASHDGKSVKYSDNNGVIVFSGVHRGVLSCTV